MFFTPDEIALMVAIVASLDREEFEGASLRLVDRCRLLAAMAKAGRAPPPRTWLMEDV